jgi:hypothetical protein
MRAWRADEVFLYVCKVSFAVLRAYASVDAGCLRPDCGADSNRRARRYQRAYQSDTPATANRSGGRANRGSYRCTGADCGAN